MYMKHAHIHRQVLMHIHTCVHMCIHTGVGEKTEKTDYQMV